jgi:hypothetical protein
VKRLDAVYQLPDGSRAEVVRYGGYDLERWNQRTGEIEPINLRSNKEALIGGAWVQVYGTIEPPESLVGKMGMFELYPSKRIGKNVAKNVLIPLAPAFDPSYTYTGEVQVFTVTREQQGSVTEDSATASVNGAVANAGVVALDEAAVLAALPSFLDGKSRNDAAGIINALPKELRHGNIVNGIINGTVFDQLVAAGSIAIASDGSIATVVGTPA